MNVSQDALGWIQRQSAELTRRSAGLPAILVSILGSLSDKEDFDHIILDLQAVADAPVHQVKESVVVKLPQVHALNCLREIFLDARFDWKTEPFMADTLSIAIEKLESEM